MRFQGVCYRAHDPRWAWTPLSGEGAALRGGRFNPQGVPALYLALTLDGMFLEMGHGLAHRFEPLTVCTYEVDCDEIVPLATSGECREAGVNPSDLAAPWLADRSAGKTPTSWKLARRLMGKGAAGIIVPSYAQGASDANRNLVLWRWGPDLPHKVSVFDPSGRLPKDQLSWPV